jgi:Coenzyme PQQ synthesis protein D (PqqD)
MLPLNTRLGPNEAEVAAKVIDGEAILINLSNGMYYSMDQVGGLIWTMISEGHSLAAIASAVAESYDVSAAQAQADLERVAAELVHENLVVVASEDRQVGGDQQPLGDDRSGYEVPLDGRLAYEAPRLNKYDDMAELLALDPPMPAMAELAWKESSEQASR